MTPLPQSQLLQVPGLPLRCGIRAWGPLPAPAMGLLGFPRLFYLSTCSATSSAGWRLAPGTLGFPSPASARSNPLLLPAGPQEPELQPGMPAAIPPAPGELSFNAPCKAQVPRKAAWEPASSRKASGSLGPL